MNMTQRNRQRKINAKRRAELKAPRTRLIAVNRELATVRNVLRTVQMESLFQLDQLTAWRKQQQRVVDRLAAAHNSRLIS